MVKSPFENVGEKELDRISRKGAGAKQKNPILFRTWTVLKRKVNLEKRKEAEKSVCA